MQFEYASFIHLTTKSGCSVKVKIRDQEPGELLLPAAAAAAAAKSLQLCPTLCDPIDSSPPSSAIPGFLEARVLE